MVTIEKHEYGVPCYTKPDTFHQTQNCNTFNEKYKKYKILIKDLKSERNWTLGASYTREPQLHTLVKDFGSNTQFYIEIQEKDRIITTTMQQFPGLCGICTIQGLNYALFSEEIMELLCDLFKYMGYTALVLSTTTGTGGGYATKIRDLGFEPFMNLTNRRTSNNVTIFYKRL